MEVLPGMSHHSAAARIKAHRKRIGCTGNIDTVNFGAGWRGLGGVRVCACWQGCSNKLGVHNSHPHLQIAQTLLQV